MAQLGAVTGKLAKEGRLGPVARLLPTTTATTLRKGKDAIVLDGGRVIEQGSHEALLAAGGRYATLFKLQARGYV